MKIAVYAICRDELPRLERWLSCASEADYVRVLDTGSTDGTWEALRAYAAGHPALRCERDDGIVPFRFDEARNKSLAMVPDDADVCVCLDIDEWMPPGWRAALEAAWVPGCAEARYEFVWAFDAAGNPSGVMDGWKIHRRHGVRWVHACHEVLEYDGDKQTCRVPVRMEHHPDGKAPRDYLPGLQLAVQLEPECARNWYYLGREQYYRARWADADASLQRYLEMQSGFAQERSSAMVMLADCTADSELWLLRAAVEAPWRREAWLGLAELYNREKRYPEAERMARHCLDELVTRDGGFTEAEDDWHGRPWRALADALDGQGRHEWAANCRKNT